MTGAAPRWRLAGTEPLHLGVDDDLGGDRFLGTVPERPGHPRAERVHVEQRHPGAQADAGVDVARDAEVDDQQRPRHRREVLLPEHVRLGRHRGEDDVGVGQLGGDVIERRRPASRRARRRRRPRRARARPLLGAVDHDDAARRVGRRDVTERDGRRRSPFRRPRPLRPARRAGRRDPHRGRPRRRHRRRTSCPC